MTNIGEIRIMNVINKEDELDVEWEIPELDSLCKLWYRSRDFVFEGHSWNLGIYPNGTSNRSSNAYIDLYLYSQTFRGPHTNLEFCFAFKTSNGQKDLGRKGKEIFQGRQNFINNFISKSEYIERRSEFVVSGFLTVVCSLRILNSTRNASSIATAECTHCNEILSHEKKCRMKCPECLDVVLYKNWLHHECQTSRREASEKLSHDFETAMLTGDHSDVIVKVKGEDFKLHKVILAFRNPYFDSMFKTDMKEKSSGIVTIEDCEPDVFRSFVHFLYTGKVDKLSPENVCDLYEMADKYQEDQLKKECLQSMLNMLSIDSFCDYIVIALKHDEKELFEKAVNFYIPNVKEIGCSVRWQQFVKEYPTQANELFLKAIDHYVK